MINVFNCGPAHIVCLFLCVSDEACCCGTVADTVDWSTLLQVYCFEQTDSCHEHVAVNDCPSAILLINTSGVSKTQMRVLSYTLCDLWCPARMLLLRRCLPRAVRAMWHWPCGWTSV